MYPALFQIGPIEVRSYYTLWAFALLLFLVWTKRRAVKRYGIDADDVASVLLWVYFSAIIGAMVFGFFEKLPTLIRHPEVFAGDISRGGLSSGGGILCGGLGGIYRTRKLGVSLNDFAEAASLPMAFMLSVGRIGCFLEGCCLGFGAFSVNPSACSVHFPFDSPGFYRFPAQMSESIAALLIGILLFIIEKYAPKRGIKIGGGTAILWPLFNILYGAYRLIFDGFRELAPGMAFRMGHFLGLVSLLLGIAWLYWTYRTRKRENEALL
ncbi:prolipoprotein diacylglyceryl transferase [Synergistaceae bacterium OttesenSCG-928-D05]|nr:prolipoprotein diacylglyceryl transferase [Synergistaceae bacterium OttesenSCG-928-D05]